MHGCIYLLMLKTKFCWRLLWCSLVLLRAESRSAGRVTSEVLDDTLLFCWEGFVCLFFLNSVLMQKTLGLINGLTDEISLISHSNLVFFNRWWWSLVTCQWCRGGFAPLFWVWCAIYSIFLLEIGAGVLPKCQQEPGGLSSWRQCFVTLWDSSAQFQALDGYVGVVQGSSSCWVWR